MKPNISLPLIKLTLKTLILLISFTIPCTNTSPITSSSCNRTCGEHTLKYPFGFSHSCPIQLKCTTNNTILVSSDFQVQSITNETIIVHLPVNCNRSVGALAQLFGPNYALSSLNAILLQNCTNHTASSCFLPQTMVETNFELHDCGAKNQSVSCYSENATLSKFVNYKKILQSGCGTLFSAISMVKDSSISSFENGSSTWISLDVQVVRLVWWINGECSCDRNAKCVHVTPFSDGGSNNNTLTAAHRCECLEGYEGDGFSDGIGCQKESPCNPSKYMSGKCGGTTRIGVLVGGVAAGASLMIIIALISILVRKRSKLRTQTKRTEELSQTTGIKIPIYPYKEMEKATDHFSDKRRLGNGAYGTVYLGKLSNDEWVAIKRIRQRDHSDSIEQVLNEIKILSLVGHPNLVRLLGCCVERDEQILVYEYMPNGTLSQHLQGETNGGPLPWPARLAIACETARAVSHLHNAATPPIYHRDIKSSNILLDYDYGSKVADFGLSRLGLAEPSSHISTAPQGTPGYLDPQYHQHFHLSDKSDVYSFGVVLVEIITGLKVVDFARPQDEVNLASLAIDRIGKGRLDEIIDPFLVETLDEWAISSIRKVGELAFRCLAFHRDMRPLMMEVAIELEQIRSSRWGGGSGSGKEVGSSNDSLCSDSSDKPMVIRESDGIGAFGSMDSSDSKTVGSVGDSWRTDRSSSPGSISLLNHVV